MTFEEWFNRYNNEVEGFLDYKIQEMHEDGDLNFDTVKDLMELSWDARYFTLTNKDI